MESKLSPCLETCKSYGYTPAGQIGLASLAQYESPPPGHVNSLVPMFVQSNRAASLNLAYTAKHFARLAAKLAELSAKAQNFEAYQPGALSADMRDVLVHGNELVTNACIVGDGMTGAMRVPDAVTMLLCSRKNPAGSDCGREVAQPLLAELDQVLEGDAPDLSSLGASLHAYWGRIKEQGLLLSLGKLQGVRGAKLPPHLMGVLSAFREQLFMALATAPMQVMRRSTLEQYALPDCLEAIVRMHNLGPTRALEIAAELGCGCLLPGSLEPQAMEGRQMTGAGACSMMTVKTLIKEDRTSADAISAHASIKAKPRAKPKIVRKRALEPSEALELAEIKVENTAKSRARTKDSTEGGVEFVRSFKEREGKRRKTANSQRASASTSLHMFSRYTHQRLDKDSIATAVSTVQPAPIHLVQPFKWEPGHPMHGVFDDETFGCDTSPIDPSTFLGGEMDLLQQFAQENQELPQYQEQQQYQYQFQQYQEPQPPQQFYALSPDQDFAQLDAAAAAAADAALSPQVDLSAFF
jgi:hypothetical protein